MTELLHAVLDWVRDNQAWTGWIVFLVCFAESLAVIGMIVPGVIVLIGVGALVSAGVLDFWELSAWGIAGAVLGDALSYWLGAYYRESLLKVWPFSAYPDAMASGERFIHKHGPAAVAFARFVGPGRATVPLVAGIMGMSQWKFFIANIVSAIAWAPAYLLPGVVLGASLELASEVAARFVVLLGVVIVVLWFGAWATRRITLWFQPRAAGLVRRLLRLGPARMRHMAQALADPQHPDAGALAGSALTLLVFALAFVILAAAPGLDPLITAMDTAAVNLAQTLASPPADRFLGLFAPAEHAWFILFALIGGLFVFLLGGRRQTGRHWLYGLGFPLLGVALARLVGLLPDDGGVLLVVSCASVFALIAVLRLSPGWRAVGYTLISLATLPAILAHWYTQATNLSSMLAQLTIALAWSALLGLAYRAHRDHEKPGLGLLGATAAVLILAWMAALHIAGPNSRPRVDPPAVTLTEQAWLTRDWRRLPSRRGGLTGLVSQPLNLQYAGELAVLADKLEAHGWRPPHEDTAAWLRGLSGSATLEQLPLMPQVYNGHYETRALIRALGDERVVLRLWSTPIRLGDRNQPLWVGSVSLQRRKSLLGMFYFGRTGEAFARALQLISADLERVPGLMHRQTDDGRMLLTPNLPSASR